MKLFRRFAREERGAALLEFAIFASLLLMLFFGIIDLGRALFVSNNLVSAAREGARFAAVQVNPGGNSAAFTQAVQDTVVARMSPFGNAAPVRAMVAVTCRPNANCTGLQSIQVQVNYPFTWLTPIRSLVSGISKDTLRARATYKYDLGS